MGYGKFSIVYFFHQAKTYDIGVFSCWRVHARDELNDFVLQIFEGFSMILGSEGF